MQCSRRRIVASFAVALAIGVCAAACSGSKKPGATPTPTGPTSTPAPTATPTLPPATLDQGDQLGDAGSYEDAVRVYAAIAATPQAVDRQQQARLSQAQLLSRTGRSAEARTVLDAYLDVAGATANGTAARYLLASTLDDLGDMAGALDCYELYINAGGAASDFARIERAKLLARLGRPLDASSAAEAVLASDILPDFKASFVLSMGRAFEQGLDDADALAWYVRAQTYPGADVGSALARSGAVKKRLADATWIDDYTLAIAAYPSSGSAPDLLDELDAAAVPVSDYVRGVVSYRAHRNDVSRAALDRAIVAGDNAASAAYYLGALDERDENDPAAIDHYARSYMLDLASPVADDALWWGGRLLEQAGRLDEAAASYANLATGFPSSTWYGDASFRRGLVQYKAKNYAGAALIWSQIASSATGTDALRAHFWQGKALKQAKDSLADSVLRQLVDDPAADGNLYALRAEVLLSDNESSEHDADLDSATVDWSAIAAFVHDATGVDPSSAVIDERAWSLATELDAVGLHAQSTAVFASMFKEATPDVLYAMSRRFFDAGEASLAARAANTLIGAIEERPQTSPPRQPAPLDLERVAYPAAFAGLVHDAADTEGISPLLLLALVRQESYFDADAGSTAGALGLTQVVPTTGQSIAASLGVTEFASEDLFRPKTSLRFGAYYLAAQLREFDDDPYKALAAYNGGPGAASDAIDAGGGDDPDLFIEELEFDETRLYVRLVMQNLARYRQLYEGLDRPSLAR